MRVIDWHNCNGKIGRRLHYVLSPLPEWNDGQPSWALVLVGAKSATYLPISYCPICGERLPEQEGQDEID